MKITVVLLSFFVAFGAGAHPGGLDANGGHIDRKTGVYHYHRGTNAPSDNAPSPQVVPAQNQSRMPDASDVEVAGKRIETETKTGEFQKPEAEAGFATSLKNLPWWVYLVGLGCGYVVWEMASYFYQKKHGQR